MMGEPTAAPSSVGDYFAALRRRYIYFATLLPLALFICVVAAFAIRPLYQATATIMLEPSSVPKDIIESTVITYSDQQVEIVQGRVLTPAGLAPVLKQVDPYPQEKKFSDAQKVLQIIENTSIERVDPVTLKPQAESNAFSLHYNNPDPEIAVAVTDRLAQLFLTYNQVRRSAAASEATGFLQKQSEDLARQMREVDAQLAALKGKYGEATPEFMMRNETIIEDTQHQLDNLQQQILTAQEKESELSLQLSQMSPNLITQSGDLTDMATVRAKLTEAEQRYTADHPEVKRLKRALETLVAQSGGAAGSKVPPNNPQYLMTRTELKGARNSLASLHALDGSLRAKLARSRGLVQGTPAAEREFSAVLRRREVLQNEYQHTQDRLQSANLAESFESAQGGERFSMVHAPSVPKLPVYPNRIGLILLGLVFGSALAGVGAALAESGDKKVRTARDVVLPDGVPVLASIPFIKNTKDRRRRAIMLTSFAAAYGLAIFVAAAVIVSSRFH
jgi:succinoglycan biosynthesis transport protein ExoP